MGWSYVDVTDATLEASGLWLGSCRGPVGTATLAKSFFGRSPWLHGQQVVMCYISLVKNEIHHLPCNYRAEICKLLHKVWTSLNE